MTDLAVSSPRTARSREGPAVGASRSKASKKARSMPAGSIPPMGGARSDEEEDEAPASHGLQARRGAQADFVEWGPPPDMRQRELIFDSLAKIVHAPPTRGGHHSHAAKHAEGASADSRGTYVFTYGAGFNGQLGRRFARGQKKYAAIPMLVSLPAVVRSVACGGLHTTVVTEDGKVYTWGGSEEAGHVALHDPALKQTPRLVEMLDNVFVMSVACGGSHTVALTDNGQLYSWGLARTGQLGHGDRSVAKFPRRIEHPLVRDIVAVAAGARHTMALTKGGAALAWGSNRHGQLGLGDFEDRLEPHRIDSLRGVFLSSLSCGAIHSCLVSQSGELWTCGFGQYFTTNESQHFFPEPKKIELPEPIKQISCGQAHNLALTVSGNVLAWGSGDQYGQIGFGIKGNSATPRLVLDSKNIRQVAAGRYHSVALTDAGVLYSWGCGESGQLGLNSDENMLLPTVVTPILGTVVGQVSCGEHHTAILTSAPWTKLSADVHEWLHTAKVENEHKEAFLRTTHRGLTAKDLQKLAQKKQEWLLDNAARSQQLEAESARYMANEVDSVLFERELQEEVARAFAQVEQHKSEHKGNSHTASMKRLHLPPVGDARDDEEEKKPDGARMGQTVPRLPTLGKKKTSAASLAGSQTERAHSSSQAALAQVQYMDGSATVRLDRDRSLEATARAHPGFAATERAAPPPSMPSARGGFLKDTAGMLKRMTQLIHDKGEAQSVRELNEAVAAVFGCRKEHDQLRHTVRAMQKRCAELKRELELLESSNNGSQSSREQIDTRLHNLQMQLSTVTIKLAETSENRRNYELNIAHLNEDHLEHFQSLKMLRRQNAELALALKKMKELRAAGMSEKGKSESELVEFRQEVSQYQKFVSDQIAQFQSILGIVRAQQAKRERAKHAREEKQSQLVTQRVSQLSLEHAAASKESGSLAQRLQSLDLKLAHFEDSFEKISAATGLNHPDAIVNKFFFKSEIREQLQSEIDDKQHTLESMRAERDALRAQLGRAKLSFKDQTWRDVEQLSENAREVATRSSKAQKEIERVTQRLAFVQESMLTLLRGVESHVLAAAAMAPLQSPADEEGNTHLDTVKGLWTPNYSSQVLSKLESAVDCLFSELAREQEQRHLLELSSQQRAAAAAVQKASAERSAAQAKVFGLVNIKNLRMISQQQQQQQQGADGGEQHGSQGDSSASASGDDASTPDQPSPSSADIPL